MRRWPNIKPTVGIYIVFVVIVHKKNIPLLAADVLTLRVITQGDYLSADPWTD